MWFCGSSVVSRPHVVHLTPKAKCVLLSKSGVVATLKPYTGCPRRNVKYFGRVFLMLNYTDITQNTYPKLNGYGVNGHRKVWASVVSTNCTPSVTQYSSTAQARQGDFCMQWPWRKVYNTVAVTSQDKERSGGLRTVLRSLRRAKTWMREFL